MNTNTMKMLDSITGDKLTLGGALRALRLADDISQGDFAETLKVTQSYLSDLENNRKEISPQKAAEFANLLGHSEKQFVRLAVQDSLARKGLNYLVDIKDAV